MHIITIGSSSKKAGKSTLASLLVAELGADFALKVSGGGHGDALISDRSILARPGTDTGKLIEAGAKQVLWVDCGPSAIEENIQRALETFRGEGLLVAEGNAAVSCLDADFSIFLMGVPFDQFKPSAIPALEKAGLVLVDTSRGLDCGSTEIEVHRRVPSADVICYTGLAEAPRAWSAAISMTKDAIHP